MSTGMLFSALHHLGPAIVRDSVTGTTVSMSHYLLKCSVARATTQDLKRRGIEAWPSSGHDCQSFEYRLCT